MKELYDLRKFIMSFLGYPLLFKNSYLKGSYVVNDSGSNNLLI